MNALRTLALLLPLLGVAPTAEAVTIVQPNVQPVFDFEFSPGTPFNSGSTPFTVPFRALGEVTLEILDANLADLAATTIPLESAVGAFQGVLPNDDLPLPAGTPFNLTAFEFVSGELTNVVRGPAGSIDAADVEFTVRFEQVVAPGTSNQVRLFADPMTFNGSIDGVPFSVGTTFEGPDFIDAFVDLGGGNSAPVGGVFNRFLNVVPEPSSCLLATGLLAAMPRSRRRC